MKTAMQELIDYFIDNHGYLTGDAFLKKAQELLETEKRQLISAADTMYRNGLSKYPITADEYFEENFGA